jgi:soluble lytic murein transglycosylase
VTVFRYLLIASFLSLCVVLKAAANVPTPRIKPTPPALSQYLSDKDAETLRRGLRAARRGEWITVKRAKDSLSDPVAQDLLRWVRVARDPQAPRDWMDHVVHDLSDWPRMTGIRAKAEAQLFDDPPRPDVAIDWFRGTEPVSGEGRAVLARAYFSKGETALGQTWLKSAWRDARLTRDRQRELFRQYRNKLEPEDHAARADHLIWLGSNHFAKARALLPHMSKADRAVMDARIRLAGNSSGLNAAVNAIPSGRATDAAFLYERARWRRKRKSKEYALPIFQQIKDAPLTERGRERMWTEKRLMAYWLMSEEKWDDAYAMTQNSGAPSGRAFYEPEFLAGFIALRRLNKPQLALEHFQRLERGVSTPISLARARYWQGRAHEALRDGNHDWAYSRAAEFPNTYYGQLAAVRFSRTNAQLILPPEIVSPDTRALFEADRRVRALRLLGEAGEERFFSAFAFHLDDVLPDLESLSLLSELSADYGFQRPALRAAKQAGRFQSMLTDSSYPLVAPIEALGEAFDIPFVYAIARQESEFAAGAISSARAYGMMQMINATARATARKHRIPFDKNRLIADRDYSARLGALHLHDLLERFDGSYILAAVGYNAGPHRAKQWIEAYGDPRTGEIDPIDWVEMIPFSETRNYVMRVMENKQVYQARRNNDIAPVTIDKALIHGTDRPAIR